MSEENKQSPSSIEEEKQNKLVQIEERVKELKGVDSMEINSEEDVKEASAILGEIVRDKKRIEEIRQNLVKPLNDHVRNINAEFKRAASPLAEIEKKLKSAILVYRQKKQAEMDAQREEQIKKEKEEFEAEKKRKLAEADSRQDKKEIKKEEYKPSPAPKVESSIKAGGATVTTRQVWKFEVQNAKLVPDEYKKIDETAIRKAVNSGVREIPGVKIFKADDMSVRT